LKLKLAFFRPNDFTDKDFKTVRERGNLKKKKEKGVKLNFL